MASRMRAPKLVQRSFYPCRADIARYSENAAPANGDCRLSG
jgi:hypothetical protein